MAERTAICGVCGNSFPLPNELAAGILEAVQESGVGEPMCQECLDDLMARRPDREPPVVHPSKSEYQFTADMREISGFGGGYEQTCRNMVSAGLDWFDCHPDAKPAFHGYRGVMGIVVEDNADAESLSKALSESALGDATGAMHEAAVWHVLKARAVGWDAYCREMRKLKAEEESEAI